MSDDEFTRYNGEGNPLKGTQGAVVRLRSGELAIIAPQDNDEMDLETETVWHQIGDEDDIVAYKPLSTPNAEIVARAAANYLRMEDVYTSPPFGEGAMSKHLVSSARLELQHAIERYKSAWPDWPEYAAMRRLRDWESAD